jgi:hypothetical protein
MNFRRKYGTKTNWNVWKNWFSKTNWLWIV